ncbi:hypothetical protein TWF718_006274 [Orbilia javanica]|uniref:Uncharacterized protein n=1 Tax=Orbilia javanica TaxID=47235 RepID=A0AAN8N372_9PEZI
MPRFLHFYGGAVVLAFLSLATCQTVSPPQWAIISTVEPTVFTPPATCSSSTLWYSTATDAPSPVNEKYYEYADAVLYKADCFADLKCCPEGFVHGTPQGGPGEDIIYKPGVCPSGYIGKEIHPGDGLPINMNNVTGAQYCCPSSIPATSSHMSARLVVCASTFSVDYTTRGNKGSMYSYPTLHIVVATPIYVVPPSTTLPVDFSSPTALAEEFSPDIDIDTKTLQTQREANTAEVPTTGAPIKEIKTGTPASASIQPQGRKANLEQPTEAPVEGTKILQEDDFMNPDSTHAPLQFLEDPKAAKLGAAIVGPVTVALITGLVVLSVKTRICESGGGVRGGRGRTIRDPAEVARSRPPMAVIAREDLPIDG